MYAVVTDLSSTKHLVLAMSSDVVEIHQEFMRISQSIEVRLVNVDGSMLICALMRKLCFMKMIIGGKCE